MRLDFLAFAQVLQKHWDLAQSAILMTWPWLEVLAYQPLTLKYDWKKYLRWAMIHLVCLHEVKYASEGSLSSLGTTKILSSQTKPLLMDGFIQVNI